MSESSAEQRCYLHPDRLARIYCQRCGRPICPADMREASVGFQCPPCVTAGVKTQRRAKTVLGGRVSMNPRSVTSILIAVNVAIFALTFVTGQNRSVFFQVGDMWGYGVASGQYWRLLTAAFLHNGIIHLAFNMFALYLFAPVIEEALGRAKYLLTYLTLAIASSVWIYWLTAPNIPTVGASGVVYGLLGVVFMFMYYTKQDLTGILILLGINALLSLQSGISWQGHLGGFVTGIVLGAAFVYAPRERQASLHRTAFIAVWVAILVATILRTAMLTA